MDRSLICVLSIVCVVGLLPSGGAIQCFECNSGSIYDKEACANLVQADKDSNFVTNCSTLPPRDGFPHVRCRTMVQDVDNEVRIVRSCATWPDTNKANRCVDRTGTSKIKVRYCECDTDFCNGSSKVYTSFLVFLFGLLGLQIAKHLSR